MVGRAAAADLVVEVPVEIGKDSKKIPCWLSRYLIDVDLPKIAESVQHAEAKTSGEIVPMVVERSSTVGHVPGVLALVLFSGVLLLDLNSHWEALHEFGIYLTPLMAILCYLVGILLSRFWVVQRILTPNFDEALQVEIRAELEFHRLNVGATEHRTGILIFISMMERRVVVLADQGISAHLPPETWQKLVADLVKALKERDLKGGLTEAIRACGELLSQKLPAKAHDPNEIANDLVIKP